jgi:hypothetical protein
MKKRTFVLVAAGLVVSAALGAFLVLRGDIAQLTETGGMGPSPVLPAPIAALLPIIHVASARAWPAGRKPKPASGLSVNAFATGRAPPRKLRTATPAALVPRLVDARSVRLFFTG